MSYNTILATAPLTTQNYHLKMIGTSIGNSLIWDNGTNVGIGNTNTSYTLDVSGTGRFTSTLLVSGAATFGSTITASGNLNLQAGAVRNINFYDSSNTNINAQIQYDQISATSGQLFFGTNNAGTFATRLTITNAGNVGIGQSTPIYLLDLKASATPLRIVQTTSASNQIAWIKLRQSDANNFGADIGIDTTTGGDFVIGRNNATDTFTETFRIARANGNTGIGCVPSFKLQVQGDDAGSYDQASGQFVISGATNSNKRLNIGYNTTNNIGFIQAGINGTGYSTLLLNPNGGNVVIGTTTDQGSWKAQVTGNIFIRGNNSTSANSAIYTDNSSGTTLLNIRNDGLFYTGTAALSPYNYGVSGGVALYVGSSGQLGYNSSTRQSKTNIVNIENVEWLKKLTPVNFNKRKVDDDNNYLDEFESELEYGLIAEDVQEVNNDMVFSTNDGKLKGVHYDKLIVPILKLVQEQQAQIQNLQEQINILAK